MSKSLFFIFTINLDIKAPFCDLWIIVLLSILTDEKYKIINILELPANSLFNTRLKISTLLKKFTREIKLIYCLYNAIPWIF